LNGSTHENGERLSRQQAAERLTDLAYALMTGGPLTFDGERQVTLPIADEIVLKRSGTANGDRIQLELELSWSTPRSAT
jgi:amphi-Trp domain-containing protein